jgi:hypothetical protein
MVKPGGRLLMMEPSADFFLTPLRRAWYRHDRWFEADTEEALKHDDLIKMGSSYFTLKRVRYMGGPAFFLILNSLITRVPLALKPALSTVLFPAEGLYNRLPGRRPFAVFLAEWRRVSEDTPARKVSEQSTPSL